MRRPAFRKPLASFRMAFASSPGSVTHLDDSGRDARMAGEALLTPVYPLTNGNAGGKLQGGKVAVRSPARSFSEASRRRSQTRHTPDTTPGELFCWPRGTTGWVIS